MKEISTGIQALQNRAKTASDLTTTLDRFFLQRGQSLIANFPPFKNCEDHPAGKTSARALAEEAGTLFPYLDLLPPFATQLFRRVSSLVHVHSNRLNVF